MDFSTSTISNTIDKGSIAEDMSLYRASMEDAENRLRDKGTPEAISNEIIQEGDEILNTYQVTSAAIHGGMGSVWRVHHRNWNVDLAMKRPQPRFFAEGGARKKEAFVAECENWIDLGLHPNIVSCYYVRDLGGVPTIFSEWMENGSLKDRIKDGSVYAGSEKEAEGRLLDIAVQFANGLLYAHEAGLLHQDVKPDNLLLNNYWEAKVADFGLAQARAGLSDTELSSGGDGSIRSSGYTPAYCSPEQSDGKAITRSTDIYSWAASVLELFLGERPWKSGVEAGRYLNGSAGRARVSIPSALEDLLRKCLDPDPLKRPQDFADVKAELQKIFREQTGSDPFRPEPEKAVATADSLNNRALSYLDLGKPEEAEKCWAEALKQNGGHAESVYNRALMQWRDRRISDLDVLTSLGNCTRDPNYDRLQTKIELERGNPEGISQNADPADIQTAAGLPPLDQTLDKPYSCSYRELLTPPEEIFGSVKADGKIFHPVFSSPDGSRLFTKEKAVLDARSRTVIKNLEDIPMLISPDGKIFAARYDRPDRPSSTSAVIYDTDTMEPLKIMRGSGFLEGILYAGTEDYKTTAAFSPDGSLLYLGNEDSIRSVNTETGEETPLVNDLDGFPFRLAVSPDGKLLAATQRRGILLVDADSGRHLRTISLDHPSAISFLGERIVASENGNSKTPEEIFVSMNTPVFTFHAEWALSRIRTTRQQIENERLFTSGLAKAQESYEKGEYKDALDLLDSARQIDGKTNDPRALSLNRTIGANGNRIALESADIVRELSFGSSKCCRIAFSDDGSRMLCHCNTKALLIETATGNVLNSFSDSGSTRLVYQCNDFALDHAGKTVLFGKNCLFDADTGRSKGTLQGLERGFYAACFTPDDSHVAVVGKDETLRIYRTADCSLEAEIVIGPLPVYDLVILPDGDTLLANAHKDREIEKISLSRKKIVNLMETPDFYGKTYVESGSKYPVVKTIPSNVQVLFRRIDVSPDGNAILLEGDDFRCFTMDTDTHRLIDGAADLPVIRRAVYTGWGSQVLRVEAELLILHAGSIVSASWRIHDTKVSIASSLKADADLVLRIDRKGLNDIAVSPNGRYAVIVPDSGVVLLYELNWKYEIRAAEKGLMSRMFRAFSGKKGKR